MDSPAPHEPGSHPAPIHLQVDMATWLQFRDEVRHLHAQFEYIKLPLKLGVVVTVS